MDPSIDSSKTMLQVGGTWLFLTRVNGMLGIVSNVTEAPARATDYP